MVEMKLRVCDMAGLTVLCSWARFFSLSASFHPGVQMGTGGFNAEG